jgi:hypothetical protein
MKYPTMTPPDKMNYDEILKMVIEAAKQGDSEISYTKIISSSLLDRLKEQGFVIESDICDSQSIKW